MNSRIILFICFVICSIQEVAAQRSYYRDKNSTQNGFYEDKEKWTKRLVYGGDVMARFIPATVLGTSPYIGHRVTDWFVPGINFNYLYFASPNFSDSRYGASIFTRFFIREILFAHFEYGEMNINTQTDPFLLNQERQWVSNFMIGSGVYISPGGGLGVTITALYVLNHNPSTSPYGGLAPYVIRFGIMFYK